MKGTSYRRKTFFMISASKFASTIVVAKSRGAAADA